MLEVEPHSRTIKPYRRHKMLGENIRNEREKLNYSQTELAKKLEVTRQTISNWESNKREPDLNSLKKLSDVLMVSTDTLLGIKDDEKLRKAFEEYKLLDQEDRDFITSFMQKLSKIKRDK